MVGSVSPLSGSRSLNALYPSPPWSPLDDVARDAKIGVEHRPPRALDAMRRPDPALLDEVRGRRRMPVLRVHDVGARGRRLRDLLVRDGDHVLSVLHVQAARGVREIVLNVDDD